MSIARDLFEQAFDRPRTPRSPAYKQGVLDVLRYRSGETLAIGPCPYKIGTSQADAWFSGVEEGHAIWRRYQAGQGRAA